MVDKIKHTSSIVLVVPTKSVFKHNKTCCTQHTQISMASSDNSPVCPCIKKTMDKGQATIKVLFTLLLKYCQISITDEF